MNNFRESAHYMSCPEEVHKFMDRVRLANGPFFQFIRADELDDALEIHTPKFIHVANALEIQGLRSDLAPKDLKMPLKKFIGKVFVDNGLTNVKLTIRTYNCEGKEKCATGTYLDFMSALDRKNPPNVIDFVPPGRLFYSNELPNYQLLFFYEIHIISFIKK